MPPPHAVPFPANKDDHASAPNPSDPGRRARVTGAAAWAAAPRARVARTGRTPRHAQPLGEPVEVLVNPLVKRALVKRALVKRALVEAVPAAPAEGVCARGGEVRAAAAAAAAAAATARAKRPLRRTRDAVVERLGAAAASRGERGA